MRYPDPQAVNVFFFTGSQINFIVDKKEI